RSSPNALRTSPAARGILLRRWNRSAYARPSSRRSSQASLNFCADTESAGCAIFFATMTHKRPWAILFFALLLALTYAYPQPQGQSQSERFRQMSLDAESKGLAEPFKGITTNGTVEPGL